MNYPGIISSHSIRESRTVVRWADIITRRKAVGLSGSVQPICTGLVSLAVYTVQCALCGVQCKLYTAHCTVYRPRPTAHCAVREGDSQLGGQTVSSQQSTVSDRQPNSQTVFLKSATMTVTIDTNPGDTDDQKLTLKVEVN